MLSLNFQIDLPARMTIENRLPIIFIFFKGKLACEPERYVRSWWEDTTDGSERRRRRNFLSANCQPASLAANAVLCLRNSRQKTGRTGGSTALSLSPPPINPHLPRSFLRFFPTCEIVKQTCTQSRMTALTQQSRRSPQLALLLPSINKWQALPRSN